MFKSDTKGSGLKATKPSSSGEQTTENTLQGVKQTHKLAAKKGRGKTEGTAQAGPANAGGKNPVKSGKPIVSPTAINTTKSAGIEQVKTSHKGAKHSVSVKAGGKGPGKKKAGKTPDQLKPPSSKAVGKGKAKKKPAAPETANPISTASMGPVTPTRQLSKSVANLRRAKPLLHKQQMAHCEALANTIGLCDSAEKKRWIVETANKLMEAEVIARSNHRKSQPPRQGGAGPGVDVSNGPGTPAHTRGRIRDRPNLSSSAGPGGGRARARSSSTDSVRSTISLNSDTRVRDRGSTSSSMAFDHGVVASRALVPFHTSLARRARRGARFVDTSLGGDSGDEWSSPDHSTEWPYRVTDRDHKRLCELFGPFENPEYGVLRSDAVWRILVKYGDKMIGGGRWLPSTEHLAGKEAGISWNTELYARRGVWSLHDLGEAEVEISFPGKDAKSVVPFSRLLSGDPKANFGKLSYYVKSDGNYMLRELKPVSVSKRLADRFKYFVGGRSYYTVDAPDGSCQASASFIDRTIDFCTGGGVSAFMPGRYAVTSVPKSLVEELAPRAAGRVRNEALLRDLTRAANVIVGQSALISPECRGRVAVQLAWLAMVYNSENELALATNIVPGSLRLNAALANLWAGRATQGIPKWGWLLVAASTTYVGRHRRSIVRRIGSMKRPTIPRSVDRGLERMVAALAYGAGATTGFAQYMVRLYSHGAGFTVGTALAMLFLLRKYFGPPPKGEFLPKLANCVRNFFGFRTEGAGTKMLLPGDLPQTRPITTLLSVVGEELLKRVHPVVPAIVIAAEGSAFGEEYLPTAAMHLIAAATPLPVGIFIHFVFNMSAEYDGPLREKPELQMDVCVDEVRLRDNELVEGENQLRHVSGLPISGRVECSVPKIAWHYCAVGVSGVVVDVFRSCCCNERAAVMSRVTSVDNPDLAGVWADWFARRKDIGIVPEPPFQEWLANQASIAKGLIARDPSNNTLQRNSHVMKSFVKREKAVSSIADKPVKKSPAPRIIQGRTVDVKLNTGPWTWALGKRLAAVYNLDGNILYAGGRSAEEIGQFYDRWASKRTGRWVAIDCKRWDRSVGPACMRELSKAYKQAGAPKTVIEAYKDRERFRTGVTQHGWVYKRRGQVSSGDGDTTSGNMWLHIIMVSCCASVLAAVIHGDDALLYVTDVDATLDQYVTGGFVPVLAPDVDFCSGLLWPTADGSVLGPKIGRFLAKTFYCTHKYDGGYLPWLRGVCLSVKASTSFVPILRALVKRLLELSGEGKVLRTKSYQYKSLASQDHELCEGTWDFMLERYGLSEAETLEMEHEISTITLGTLLQGDRWIALVERDVGD